MPTQNKKPQHVGTMTGSKPPNNFSSSSEPEPSSVQGIPDISFSDTSLTVFDASTNINGTWNMPVTGFGFGSIYSYWYDETGVPDTASVGNITVLSVDGSNTCIISIDFPDRKAGFVNVQVYPRSVTSALDNRAKGPPSPRGFVVNYDRKETIAPPTEATDEQPATLRLSRPTGDKWVADSYLQRFYFSKFVSGFTDADVEVSVTSGTATKGELIPSEDDNSVYSMRIALTGSGTITVRVPANIAKAGGVGENNSPPREVSESWDFAPEPSFIVGGGVDILCQEEYPITNHPELVDPTEGGMFLGVSDMKVFNNRLYFTSQIQRKRNGRNEVSVIQQSAGALVSVPISGGACRVEKKYQFFTQASRSLVEHKNVLHFFEGSAYLYLRPTLLSTGVSIPLDDIGHIQKIGTLGNMSSLGLNWRSRFPTGETDRFTGVHGGTMCAMLSDGDDLHLISQKADFFDIEGEQWIVYSNKLNQRVPLLRTNGKTGFEVLEELASISNAIMGIALGRFVFKSRIESSAHLQSDIGSADTVINTERFNRQTSFNLASGESKVVYVDGELIKYSGLTITDNKITALTTLERGAYDTTAKYVQSENEIILVDRVIQASDLSRPINDMDIEIDGTLIRNDILIRYAQDQVPRVSFLKFPASDAESISNSNGNLRLPYLLIDSASEAGNFRKDTRGTWS